MVVLLRLSTSVHFRYISSPRHHPLSFTAFTCNQKRRPQPSSISDSNTLVSPPIFVEPPICMISLTLQILHILNIVLLWTLVNLWKSGEAEYQAVFCRDSMGDLCFSVAEVRRTRHSGCSRSQLLQTLPTGSSLWKTDLASSSHSIGVTQRNTSERTC